MKKDQQLGLFERPPVRRAGRPTTGRAGIPHATRVAVSPRHPHHVTVRARRHVWNLRSQRCFARISHALRGVRARRGFRVAHFSVQGNHLHLLIEAEDRRAMTNGVRALLIRIAKRMNALMGTRGSLYVDRYHERILRNPTTVRNAMRYVLANHEHHFGPSAAGSDPFSSASPRCFALVSRPQSWLLREGWVRAP